MDQKELFERAKHIANKEGLQSAEEWLNEHEGFVSFGIEAIDFTTRGVPEEYKEIAEYINTGDTYTRTIVKDSEGYHVTTWGDWFESKERELFKHENITHCPYCGKYTPASDPLSTTECEHCGEIRG